MAKNIVLPYEPRKWQAVMHEKLTRFTVMVIHRRAGKTFFAVNELVKRALDPTEERPQVAYIAPTYKQAKQVSWEIFKQCVAPIPGVKINESELRIDLPTGGRILVLGAENPDSLRGLYLSYAVLDEVADMPANLWGAIVRPALADRQGGALFIGTPKGKNFFHELYVRGKTNPEWSSLLLTWRDTDALPVSEVESLRMELTEEEFEQELECSFMAAIRGAYYGKQMARAEDEGRIGRVKYDRDYPVIAAWDIGFDGTAIWYAQFIGNEPRIIDFDIFVEQDVPHCVNEVKNKPYVYEYQLLPHDAMKRQQTDHRKTVKGQIEKMGLKCKEVPRSEILIGINQGRRLVDKAVFDIDRCSDGLESLRQYRAQFDEAKGIMSQQPIHDKHSHPADAWRTLAMGMKETSMQPSRKAGVIGSYDPYKVNYNVQNDWDVFEGAY